MSTPSKLFWAGFRDVAPVFLGAGPFGVIVGVTAVAVGLSATQSIGMSFLVLAGASQIAALQLIETGGTLVIIFLTTAIINLRLLMYSASIAPHFRQLSWPWRLFLPFMMADQVYLLPLIRYEQEPEMLHKQWYYLGVGIPLWSIWVLTTVAGVFIGAQIPPDWQLDFVIPLVFLVLLFPAIKDRAGVVAAVVAGGTAIAAHPLPYNLGLVVAAVLGIVAGVVAESYRGGSHGSSK